MEAIFLVCGAGGPQLKRNPLGRQHVIRPVHILAPVVLVLLPRLAQDHGHLVPTRCPQPAAGDSTASIRVTRVNPADSTGPLRLMLLIPRPGGSDAILGGGVDSLSRIPPGFYHLLVQQIGYYRLRDTLRLGAGEAWCITAHMIREPVQLPAPIRMPKPAPSLGIDER